MVHCLLEVGSFRCARVLLYKWAMRLNERGKIRRLTQFATIFNALVALWSFPRVFSSVPFGSLSLVCGKQIPSAHTAINAKNETFAFAFHARIERESRTKKNTIERLQKKAPKLLGFYFLNNDFVPRFRLPDKLQFEQHNEKWAYVSVLSQVWATHLPFDAVVVTYT